MTGLELVLLGLIVIDMPSHCSPCTGICSEHSEAASALYTPSLPLILRFPLSLSFYPYPVPSLSSSYPPPLSLILPLSLSLPFEGGSAGQQHKTVDQSDLYCS